MDTIINNLRAIAATSSDRATISACNAAARELEYQRDLNASILEKLEAVRRSLG